jgi:hypothetical protein
MSIKTSIDVERAEATPKTIFGGTLPGPFSQAAKSSNALESNYEHVSQISRDAPSDAWAATRAGIVDEANEDHTRGT